MSASSVPSSPMSASSVPFSSVPGAAPLAQLLGQRGMRVGVAIPCYLHHVGKLVRCLESVAAQTLQPAAVAVSCSSCTDADLPAGLASRFAFPLLVRTTPERRNAAQNRNAAAALLAASFPVEVVSFFDADDVMHPQRLEMVRRAFVWLPGRRIVLHAFVTPEDGAEAAEPGGAWSARLERLDVLPDACRRAPSGCVVVADDPRRRVHHAHASVHRSVLAAHRFPEDARLERREDSLYCGDVVAACGASATAYIEQPLSWYEMEGATVGAQRG